ncbi:MAG TPA: hypothetical protein ENI17_02075 [Pseudomonas xinjiangensis]|uniref:Glycine zipper domain-containing protein n=2 Tax=root TaxID=1 RepID=A0A7V1FQU9_9GAMM|nr:hypothetical protein [Halopseudomonas xinjiangensis]HEC46400.1 hypothetical protein [Halopseudomonas xinjiangensis]
MGTIVAGRFESQDHAEKAMRALENAGFPRDGLSHFYVNPDGQHDIYPIGGDEKISPGARDSGKGAVAGIGIGAAAGAVAGVAATPLVGPVGVAIGAGIGAYTGSLIGAMSKTDEESELDEAEEAGEIQEREVENHEVMQRQAGTHLAVRVDDVSGKTKDQAVQILRTCGAADVEQAQGQLVDGHWKDFDPRSVVDLV